MEPLQLPAQTDSKPSEDALEAIRSIRRIFNDQDEEVWRDTAIKRYLTEEIEKLVQESKLYEIQIETLNSASPFRSTNGVTQLLKNAIEQEIKTHQLLTISVNSKIAEIERSKKDIQCWDEKYNEVISNLKDAYEVKRAFYESNNPAYEQFRLSEITKKQAVIEDNQWKEKIHTKERSLKELKEIKRNILQRSVVNFVEAISRAKQDAELNVNLRKAIARRRELGQTMLEVQEAMKKQNSIDIQRRNRNFCSNMVPNIDFSNINNQDATESTKENSSTVPVTNTKNLRDVLFVEYIKPVESVSIKRNRASDKIRVIENKAITLPSLKSILDESRSRFSSNSRSFADTSFNTSQSGDQSSQNDRSTQRKGISSQESDLNVGKSIPCISVEVRNTQKIMEGPKSKMANSTTAHNTAPNMSPEFLKNLKFTTSLPQKENNPSPLKFSFGKRFSLENQNQQKTSIMKIQNLKRKIDSQNQNEDAAIPTKKKDRNVNFASPIEEHCDNDSSHIERDDTVDDTLASNISVLDMNMLEDEIMIPTDSVQDDYSEMLDHQFSFTYDNPVTAANNVEPTPVASPPSMFQDLMNFRPSFEFSFGGVTSETSNMWDVFK